LKRIKYVIKFLKIVFWNEGILKKAFSKLLAIITLLSIVLVFYIEWIYWLLIFLFLIWVLSIYWSYSKWKGEVGKNWIESHELENGQLPTLPNYLLEIAINYTAGQPVNKEIKPKTPSKQFWNRLNPSQQDKLLGLVEWLGIDPRDYLAQMERMAPPGGEYKGLHYKR